MPRAPATSDAFNAIAEPRRRDIIGVLAGRGVGGEGGGDARAYAVGELVQTLRLPQPTVSKHLSVLRAVGIVAVTRRGRHRLYRLNAEELKPVHDWVKTYERFWSRQLDRIKERAERKAKQQPPNQARPSNHKENRPC